MKANKENWICTGCGEFHTKEKDAAACHGEYICSNCLCGTFRKHSGGIGFFSNGKFIGYRCLKCCATIKTPRHRHPEK